MKFLSKPLFLLYFLLTAGCSQDQQLLSVPVFARVEADPIGELSGIVKSPGRDNLYWVQGHEKRERASNQRQPRYENGLLGFASQTYGKTATSCAAHRIHTE